MLKQVIRNFLGLNQIDSIDYRVGQILKDQATINHALARILRRIDPTFPHDNTQEAIQRLESDKIAQAQIDRILRQNQRM